MKNKTMMEHGGLRMARLRVHAGEPPALRAGGAPAAAGRALSTVAVSLRPALSGPRIFEVLTYGRMGQAGNAVLPGPDESMQSLVNQCFLGLVGLLGLVGPKSLKNQRAVGFHGDAGRAGKTMNSPRLPWFTIRMFSFFLSIIQRGARRSEVLAYGHHAAQAIKGTREHPSP